MPLKIWDQDFIPSSCAAIRKLTGNFESSELDTVSNNYFCKN